MFDCVTKPVKPFTILEIKTKSKFVCLKKQNINSINITEFKCHNMCHISVINCQIEYLMLPTIIMSESSSKTKILYIYLFIRILFKLV